MLTRSARSAICGLALASCSLPLHAQSASILLGNPQRTSGLQAVVYAVRKSATNTTITYGVTPAPGGSPGPGFVVGRINLETVLSAGVSSVPATFNVTFQGVMQVISNSGLSFSTLGANTGSSPQQKTGTITAGKGDLIFALASPTTQYSSLTLSIDIGDPAGARLPYLNDFSGGGQTDIAVWRPSNGNWYVQNEAGSPGQAFGQAGDVLVPGDYDGDGISDFAVWRASNHTWYTRLSSTGQTTADLWGQAGDIPVPGDYDGDGQTDIAIWRASNSTWWTRLSSTDQTIVESWGEPGDIPVPGDYDGDGKTDIAIFRPSEGNFYIHLSTTGQVRVEAWGESGDIPVVGDYDGDGITDLAIWRPADGSWWIRESSTATTRVAQWGQAGDVPVPGDYDGDGKNDFAVWRPSQAAWYINESKSGARPAVLFGAIGDIPVGKPVGQ